MIKSLRVRLLLISYATIFLVWASMGVMTYSSASRNMDKAFDEHLLRSASVLYFLLKHELGEHFQDGARETDTLDPEVIKEIENHLQAFQDPASKYGEPHGNVVFQFAVSSHQEFRLASVGAPRRDLGDASKPGFSNVSADGQDWRVFTIVSPEGLITAHVAERQALRSAAAASVLIVEFIPLLVGLLVLGVLVWAGVNIALRPLETLVAAIDKRSPSENVPIGEGHFVAEVAPLIEALNRLFVRQEELLAQERQFTGNAAHELRTPLAGLKTQAQLALSTAKPQVRDRALHEVVGCVDRISGTVDALLQLARLDHELHLPELPVDLYSVAEEINTNLAPFAWERGVQVRLRGEHPALVLGFEPYLRIMARNLIDNAIRYSPKHSNVDVTVETSTTEIMLSVQDSGKGLTVQDQHNVFRPFYRGTASALSKGVGLGLSLAKRIWEVHGAAASVTSSENRGLRIEVRFPRAAAAPDALREDRMTDAPAARASGGI